MQRSALLLLLALGLAGCSTVDKWFGITPKSPLARVQVEAAEGMNDDNATQLDLVFVYDTASASLLPKTSPQWFASRDGLRASLGDAIDVVPLQLVPALVVPQAPLPARHGKAVAVASYANYLRPGGQAAGQLTHFKCVVIRLQPRDVQYQACP